MQMSTAFFISIGIALAAAQFDGDGPFNPNVDVPEAHIGVAPDYASNATETTVAEIQTDWTAGGDCYNSALKGQIVKVGGTVSAIGETQFFLQANGAGVRVDNQLFLPQIRVGDDVELVATVQESKGETELIDVVKLNVRGTSRPQAVPVSAGQIRPLCAESSEALEGMLVTLQNAVVATGKPDGTADYLKIDDGSGFTYIARSFLVQTPNEASLQDVAGYDFLLGLTFNEVTGVVRYIDDRYVLFIRSAEDVDVQPYSPPATTAPTPAPTRAPVPAFLATNAPTTIWHPPQDTPDEGMNGQDAAGTLAGGIVAGALVGMTCTLSFKRKRRSAVRKRDPSRASLVEQTGGETIVDDDDVDDEEKEEEEEERGGSVVLASDLQLV